MFSVVVGEVRESEQPFHFDDFIQKKAEMAVREERVRRAGHAPDSLRQLTAHPPREDGAGLAPRPTGPYLARRVYYRFET